MDSDEYNRAHQIDKAWEDLLDAYHIPPISSERVREAESKFAEIIYDNGLPMNVMQEAKGLKGMKINGAAGVGILDKIHHQLQRSKDVKRQAELDPRVLFEFGVCQLAAALNKGALSSEKPPVIEQSCIKRACPKKT